MTHKINPGQFGNRSDTAAMASRGGRSQGKNNNPGNFANDTDKASRAGKIGGQKSHGGGRPSGS